MSFPIDDVITAVASAPGPAPRGIVRVSGPRTLTVLADCFPAIRENLSKACTAQVIPGHLELASDLPPLPCHVYFWPDQRSYTRQPSAELHLAGSPPLLEATVEKLCQHGARLAEPGEFTMRSFLAGRLDLTQAEAVLGVIDAANQRELDVALTQLAGGLATPLHHLREQLLELLAHLEAGLDFVEEDIEFISSELMDQQLATISQAMQSTLQQIDGRSTPDTTMRVVLRGSPNVGKSSLLNALAGVSTALVSDEQGTTRDYLTHRCEINSLHCLLIDTAGATSVSEEDRVGQDAQDLGNEQARQATLELFCIDSSRPLNPWEQQQLNRGHDVNFIPVMTKADLGATNETPSQAIPTSSATGSGLEHLRQAIYENLSHASSGTSPIVHDTLLRCRESLRLGNASILRARQLTSSGQGEELIAVELRVALDELGKVVGAVYTDDLLDQIFSRFCIGK